MRTLLGTLVVLLAMCGIASAQTATANMSMAGTLTTTTANGVTNQSAVLTVTVTDPAGINSIGIYDGSTLKQTCVTSPCTATVTWTAGTARHIVSATASIKTLNQILTAQIQYAN